MRRLTLSILSLAFLAACQPAATELTEEQRVAVTDTVTQILQTISEAGSAIDVDLFLSQFSSRPVWVENGVVADWDSTVAAAKEMWGSFTEMHPGLRRPQIMVLGPSSAVMTVPFEWSVTDTEGAQIVYRGAWTLVFARGDNGWKIVYGHESWVP